MQDELLMSEPELEQEIEGNCSNDRNTAYARLLLIPLAGLGLLLALLYPFPNGGRSWNAIFDLAHAPSFLAMILFVTGVLDPSAIGLRGTAVPIIGMSVNRCILLGLAVCVFGALCEFGQALVGRSASLVDSLANSLGVLAGLLWCVSRRVSDQSRRIMLSVAAPLVISPISIHPVLELLEARQQESEFPLLASFERSAELSAWDPHEAKIVRSEEWASDGRSSLKITGQKKTRFPGVSLIWPISNWQGFSRLEVEIRNPGDTDLKVGLNVSDHYHATTSFEPTDRFRGVFEIPAMSTEKISIELSEIASAPLNREMDLSQIALVDFHMRTAADEKTVLIDNLRLVK